MKLLKTGFSRVHAVVACAALVTLVLGAGMALGLIPYTPYGRIHGILGMTIFPLLLLLPLLSPKRRNLYRALKAKLFLSRADIARKEFIAIAAKMVTMLMALVFLLQFVTGLMIFTGWTYQLFPNFSMITYHQSFLYVLGVLVLAHTALMLLHSRVKPTRKRP
ncbi:MAG: hypothetical protein LLF96_12030 [Eubacteriales bacterium]|nr:hypothetical protein [Eubacteriales bacterium]